MSADQDRGVVFFDLTQLILRVQDQTPDGIGRVELAYAQHLLKYYRDDVRFLFAMPRLVQVIPSRVAERFIEAIATVWKQEDIDSDAVSARLMHFLKADSLLVGGSAALNAARRSRRAQKLSVVVMLVMTAALQSIKPRNLGRFSNSAAINAYVNVSNSTYSSKWLIQWLARSPSVRGVFLLHDIIPISNPEYVKPASTGRHQSYVKRLAETAHAIIANSQYTQDVFEQYAATEKLPVPALYAAPLGVSEEFIRPSVRRVSAAPYFVFVATIEPRKNHLMLLHVWQRLVEKLGETAPKLIMVGRRGWENENILDIIERSEVLRSHVIECSNVPDELLVTLIGNARASLFPSHVEGFGLPLAEALALGAPVICSDIAPFREIAGDIPEYVDPLAGRGWLRLIREYAEADSVRRAAQIARLEAFAAPTWADHFSRLDKILHGCDILPSRKPGRPAEGDGAPRVSRPSDDVAWRAAHHAPGQDHSRS